MKYKPQYNIKSDRMGNITITRLIDGVSCYLQGDDASSFQSEVLDVLDNITYPSGPFKSYEEHLDAICSEYDIVMDDI